jgi:hypothetical protein
MALLSHVRSLSSNVPKGNGRFRNNLLSCYKHRCIATDREGHVALAVGSRAEVIEIGRLMDLTNGASSPADRFSPLEFGI